MEHIGDILRRRQTLTNISGENTDTSSSVDGPATPTGPDCPACRGAGFIHPVLPSGKPDFSQVVPCRCKRAEMEKDLQSSLQQFSNLGSLEQVTFASLLADGSVQRASLREQFRRAYDASREFAAAPHGWLVLTGASGAGKTRLMAAIINDRLKRGESGLYMTAPDLLDHLRSAFGPNSDIPYDELFERVLKAPLLALDDFGTQSSTPWAREKLDQLLNYRFNHELPTVIATSIPLEQMEERVRSRLTDPRLCSVCALDSGKRDLASEEAGFRWPDFLKAMTFETFDWQRARLMPEQRDNLERAYRTAMDFAKTLDGWLVFQGENGCGKTHLAAAIGNECIKAGGRPTFVSVPDFLDHLRSTFSPNSMVTYDQLFESVRKTALLVLDDFGEQSATPWANEKLYQVISYRYNNRLATVITTCQPLESIESRVSSRLADCRLSMVMAITAPDYRSDLRTVRKEYRRQRGDRPT